jgi:hypothetical protein
VGPGPFEAVDRRLVRLGVDPAVGDLLGPGDEPVVELFQ